MKQLGTRISFKNYPKIVQENSRRTLMEPTREFGKNITNIPTTRDRKDLSTNYSPRKTVLKIRSVSINGKSKVQIQNQNQKPQFDYEKTILKTLLKKESTQQRSSHLSSFEMKLRMLTLDWVIDIHYRLKLKDQTLFLFFQYFDEYCQLAKITKANMRSVAITCLWIAAKFQEVYCPRLQSFTNIASGVTDMNQMLTIQMDILQKLDYNLIRTTPLQLLNIVLDNRRGSEQQSLSKYIFQLCYTSSLPISSKPSTLVMVALNFVEHVYHQKTEYRKYIQQFGVTKQRLVQCFKQVCLLLQKTSNEINLTALKGKYSKTKNHEVSKIKLEIKNSSLINN